MIQQLQAANLFVGDDDNSKGEFLALKTVKLPSLTEKTKEHSAGGGAMTIKYGMNEIEALEMTFKLEGVNVRTMGKFLAPIRQNYTLRGSIKDLDTLSDIEVVAIVQGRMSMVETGEFSRAEGVETDYKIDEIVRYRLTVGGQEKYRFDYFLGMGGVFVDGVPMFGGAARNLGLL
jgi:uncharacterized protein